MKRRCERGFDDRCRDRDGRIWQKNSSAELRSLRGIYGEGFAEGYRADMRLGTLLYRTESASLSEYLRRRR
jgi:hypothetical protein